MTGAASLGPPPLSRPPTTLPPIAPLQWQDTVWRIADESQLQLKIHPIPRYRYDAPNGEYPALYTCALEIGTFAEVYIDRGRRLGQDQGRRHLLELHPRRSLPLIDLHDERVLSNLRLDERISMGDDYATCRQWALAFYRQFPGIAGIRYRARKAGATVANVCLYADRCLRDLDVIAAPRLEEIEEVVLRAADHYGLTVFFPFRHPNP